MSLSQLAFFQVPLTARWLKSESSNEMNGLCLSRPFVIAKRGNGARLLWSTAESSDESKRESQMAEVSQAINKEMDWRKYYQLFLEYYQIHAPWCQTQSNLTWHWACFVENNTYSHRTHLSVVLPGIRDKTRRLWQAHENSLVREAALWHQAGITTISTSEVFTIANAEASLRLHYSGA